MNFALNTFKSNDGNYQGFKSSGKIDQIENKELKKSILEYYEEHLPALYDVDRYHYSKQLEIWELISMQPDKKPLSNPVLKAKIIVDAQIVEALIKVNDKAMEKDNGIRKEIDRELNK
jgi:hypothetical protein